MSIIPIKHWSPDKIINLIEIYKQHPVLWDPGHKDFKNSELKSTIWMNIAETIGCRDAEKKMNILIVQFRRELKKIRERILAGKTEEEAATKWFAFEAMSFLKGKIRKQRGAAMPNPTSTSLNESNISFERQSEQRVHNKWKSTNYSNSSTAIENIEYDPSSTFASRSSPEMKDEYSAFGDMVAIKLRKLSTSFARNKAMNLILNSLFQVEVECEGECEETEMVYVKTLDDDR